MHTSVAAYCTALALRTLLIGYIIIYPQADGNVMCYVTFVNSLPYKAMRRLGKHTTYEFQTHVELDAPSVMCSCTLYNISVPKERESE